MIRVEKKDSYKIYDNVYENETNSLITTEEIKNYLEQDADLASNKCSKLFNEMFRIRWECMNMTPPFDPKSKIIEPSKVSNDKIWLDKANKLKDEYDLLHKQYVAIKEKMKSVIFSTVTKSPISESTILQYNKCIIFDIDWLSQSECQEVFQKLSKLDYIKLLFLSPSNHGIKFLIEFDIPEGDHDLLLLLEYHSFSYNYIVDMFKKDFYLNVDTSGSNINRKCYICSDRKIHYNPNSVEFNTWSQFNKFKKQQIKKITNSKMPKSGENIVLFNTIISYLENNKGIDIFSEYKDWITMAFLVFKNYGEKEGLLVFNKLSSFAHNYDEKSVNKKWKDIIKSYNPDKVVNEKWLMKKAIDVGLYIKPTDFILKRYIWEEIDCKEILERMNIHIIQDKITGVFYIDRVGNVSRLDDAALNKLYLDICVSFNKKMNKDKLFTFIFSEDIIERRNFIEEKLDSIITDDCSEFEKIKNHIKTLEGPDITEKILKHWMLGAMVNLFDSYYDYILCLKSKQGIGKTTFIMNYFLLPFEKWVSQTFDWNLSDKDQKKQLTENLFIYDSENGSLSKSDSKNIKKITSMKTISYRQLYGKFSDNLKKISTFIIDTNEEFVYNDSTGGRRYLVLSILNMNIFDKDGGELKKIDYEKVWGYIYYLYKRGERPNTELISELSYNIDDHRIKSDLENIIDELFIKDITYSKELTFKQIKEEILRYKISMGISTHDKGGYTDTAIGIILKKFGDPWKREANSHRLYPVKLRSDKGNDFEGNEDDYVDYVLDRISKGIQPTDKEKEILKKLKG